VPSWTNPARRIAGRGPFINRTRQTLKTSCARRIREQCSVLLPAPQSLGLLRSVSKSRGISLEKDEWEKCPLETCDAGLLTRRPGHHREFIRRLFLPSPTPRRGTSIRNRGRGGGGGWVGPPTRYSQPPSSRCGGNGSGCERRAAVREIKNLLRGRGYATTIACHSRPQSLSATHSIHLDFGSLERTGSWIWDDHTGYRLAADLGGGTNCTLAGSASGQSTRLGQASPKWPERPSGHRRPVSDVYGGL